MICIEGSAFFTLCEKVIERISEKQNAAPDQWISTDEAMHLLRLKSATTLQKLRDEGKIRASCISARVILYDKGSIIDFLEDFTYETFDLNN